MVPWGIITLTKQAQDVDGVGQADAVTPAMIEAGVREYLLHDREADDAATIVCDVFQAMAEAAVRFVREAPTRAR